MTGFGGEDVFLDVLLRTYPARISDAKEFARRYRVLLLKTSGDVGIDISLAALPFEAEVIARATSFSFGPGLDLRTCSAEDLVILKLFAARPLDIRDAESVIQRHRDHLDLANIREQLRPLAEAKGDPGILETLERLVCAS